MIKILAFLTTCAGIGMGIKTGISSFRDEEEHTTRFGENRTDIHLSRQRDLIVTCILHCFGWSLLFTLPVYILQKVWWLVIIVVIAGIIIYLGKGSGGPDSGSGNP